MAGIVFELGGRDEGIEEELGSEDEFGGEERDTGVDPLVGVVVIVEEAREDGVGPSDGSEGALEWRCGCCPLVLFGKEISTILSLGVLTPGRGSTELCLCR